MGAAVRAEFRKLFTTRLWWGMAIGIVLAGGGLAAVMALLAGRQLERGEQPTPPLDFPGMVNTVYTAGLSFAYLITLAIGVMAIGSEYRHQTISATFLSVPHRTTVMAAKVVAMLGIGAGYGILFTASSVAVGAPIIAARGFSAFPEGEDVPRTLALSLLALGLWALIGLGVGILISNQVAALMISVAVAWIGEFIIILILNGLGWNAATAYLPGQATAAMVSQVTEGGGPPIRVEHLQWWAAALVLTGYAAVLAGAGALRTVRRDIT
jgi:ABC-2 type transport system permease protein